MGDVFLTSGSQYSTDESIQMATAARLKQQVTVITSRTTVTLRNPSSIKNNTATAGNVAYKLEGETAYTTEYILAGQEVLRRLKTGTGNESIGKNTDGTAVTNILIFES